jgi:hypothetical protein
MARGLRTKDFKLGCLHGRLQAENPTSEAHIQRTIFLSQRIKVWRKINFITIIRIFGYEIPIEDYRRGRCIDLMGYDKDPNLYIIELKKRNSTDTMNKVIEQINNYADSVQRILPNIEKEYKEVFFFPIKFVSIKKMIIAPREFYKGKGHLLTDKTIDFGYFRDKDICKREPKDMIKVHLVKSES